VKYENLVSLKFAKERIKNQYRKRHLNPHPICLVSFHGVGKSSGIAQAAAELSEELGKKVECRVVNLACLEGPDLIGLPIRENGETTYLKPDFLPVEGDGTSGILLLDELNRAEKSIIGVLYTLLIDRTVGPHKFSSQWIFCTAMNPSESNEGATYDVMELDQALISRFKTYGISKDVDGLLDYFFDKYGASDPVYQAIVADNDLVSFTGGEGSPRDWEQLSIGLTVEGGADKLSNSELRSIAAADIGTALAASFCSFIKLRSYVSSQDVLFKKWNQIEASLAKMREDTRFDVETSLMRGTCDLYLRTDKKVNLETFVKFLESLRAEKAVVSFQMLINKFQSSRDLEVDKKVSALIDYAKKHKSKIIKWAKDIKVQSEESKAA